MHNDSPIFMCSGMYPWQYDSIKGPIHSILFAFYFLLKNPISWLMFSCGVLRVGCTLRRKRDLKVISTDLFRVLMHFFYIGYQTLKG